jgi:hypothetical protein
MMPETHNEFVLVWPPRLIDGASEPFGDLPSADDGQVVDNGGGGWYK